MLLDWANTFLCTLGIHLVVLSYIDGTSYLILLSMLLVSWVFNASRVEHIGPHWIKSQVVSATGALEFPKGTTDCDKYVVFNAAYADFSKKFTEAQIIDIAYLLFFKDEDWKGDGKIWAYMSINH